MVKQYIAPSVPYGNTVIFDRNHSLVFRFSEKSLPLLFEWASNLSAEFGALIVRERDAKIREIEKREALPPTHKQKLLQERARFQDSLDKVRQDLANADPLIRESMAQAVRDLESSISSLGAEADLEAGQEEEKSGELDAMSGYVAGPLSEEDDERTLTDVQAP